jgi:hypothetical protein
MYHQYSTSLINLQKQINRLEHSIQSDQNNYKKDFQNLTENMSTDQNVLNSKKLSEVNQTLDDFINSHQNIKKKYSLKITEKRNKRRIINENLQKLEEQYKETKFTQVECEKIKQIKDTIIEKDETLTTKCNCFSKNLENNAKLWNNSYTKNRQSRNIALEAYQNSSHPTCLFWKNRLLCFPKQMLKRKQSFGVFALFGLFMWGVIPVISIVGPLVSGAGGASKPHVDSKMYTDSNFALGVAIGVLGIWLLYVANRTHNDDSRKSEELGYKDYLESVDQKTIQSL